MDNTSNLQNEYSLLAGRLIMPRLQVRQYLDDTEYRKRIDAAITQGMVCGFCVFAGSVDEVRTVTQSLQELAADSNGYPLLFSCDAEWGLPMRFSGECTEFPHALALARSIYPQAIESAAKAIGQELRSIGIHWNFAPVADINSDPDNPIINIRAFGEKPTEVAEASLRFFQGLEQAGVLSVAKHFPGHGQTKIDSHRALPVLDLLVSHFEEIEFIPFRALINSGIPAIMTGHLAAPQLSAWLGAGEDSVGLPATLSSWLTYKLLRETLSFKGVIVTDSLEMSALKAYGTSVEVGVATFMAGADIVLMPPEFEGVHAAIASLLATDERWYKRAKDSTERIDTLQRKFSSDNDKVDIESHQKLAISIASKAIEALGNIADIASIKYFCIIPDDPILQKAKIEVLKQRLFKSTNWTFIEAGEENNLPIAEIAHCLLERPRGKLLDQDGEEVLSPVGQWLQRHQKDGQSAGCIILLGNPYLSSQTSGKCTVKTYSDSLPSIMALSEWIQSKI